MATTTNNALGSLNGYLFDELERLSALDTSDPEAVAAEIKRSKALEGIAKVAVDNANTILHVAELRAEYGGAQIRVPKMLEG